MKVEPVSGCSFPLVLFDGECGLCDGVVQWVLRWDDKAQFRFVSAQSVLGQALWRQYRGESAELNTFLLFYDGQVFSHSTAALQLAKLLGRRWSIFRGLLIIVPRPLRDALYRWVARHRYQFFGRNPTCFLPTPASQSRFLSELA